MTVRRRIIADWTDPPDNCQIDARLLVHDDALKALSVQVHVNLVTGETGWPNVRRCVKNADGSGEPCRELGGLSTHIDVTADLLPGITAAYGPNSDQEALYQFLEGNV